VPVLEDDPYGRVRYEGEPLPSLHELEGGELVTYASSFSKTVAPGLRVGWFVAPADLAARLEARAVATYISPPFLTQATIFELIERGAFEPNLERITGLLRTRRDAMRDALARELAGEASWSRPEGGYFLWADLPGDAADLLRRAEDHGVTFVKGADFFPPSGREAAPSGVSARSGSASADSGPAQRSARLAFSYASPSEIEEGVSTLASLLRA
jgi:DNA-binding transcriptional MocR family regulator